MLTDFHNFFVHNFTRVCQSHKRKNFLPYIRYVAIIPCESSRHKSNTFHTNISTLHMFISITLQKLASTKQTKHSRKSEAQNLCSKCPPFTRTYAFKRHHCTIAAAMTVWSSSLHSSADVLSTPSHHGSASGRRLNKHTPDAVVHQIQIWRIRWPHLWRDKLWRLSLSAAWWQCHVHDVPVPHLAEKRSNFRKQSGYPAEAYSAELYAGNSHRWP